MKVSDQTSIYKMDISFLGARRWQQKWRWRKLFSKSVLQTTISAVRRIILQVCKPSWCRNLWTILLKVKIGVNFGWIRISSANFGYGLTDTELLKRRFSLVDKEPEIWLNTEFWPNTKFWQDFKVHLFPNPVDINCYVCPTINISLICLFTEIYLLCCVKGFFNPFGGGQIDPQFF